MLHKNTFLKWMYVVLLIGTTLFPQVGTAQLEDQHSVDALVSAINSPIPPELVKEAREFDDKLISEGEVENVKIYLATDERSRRANAMVKKLLEAMGESPAQWVARVLETNPPVSNAFVTGGKYIYVYTGLIDEASSDDELAFVLAHELGHSLLKHKMREQKDISSKIAGIAVMLAMLSKKHEDDYMDFAKVATTSYSRLDEEEADAIAVAITHRAGLDPLRGADFFSRGKRQQDSTQEETQQLLSMMKQEVMQAQTNCQEWYKWYNSSKSNQTQENANKVNSICGDAEARRVKYNQLIQQNNIAIQQQKLNDLLSTHPQEQSRIGAIAALTDYVNKKRDLQSLSKYQQSYQVMQALQQVDSIVLKPPVPNSASAQESVSDHAVKPQYSLSLTDQLAQLKSAHEKGLLSDKEYEQKRQQILNRY